MNKLFRLKVTSNSLPSIGLTRICVCNLSAEHLAITCQKRADRRPLKQVSPDKVKLGQEIVSLIRDNQHAIVLHHNRLATHEWQKIRYNFSVLNYKIRVVPSKITMKAMEGTAFVNMISLFRGTSAILYGNNGNANKCLELLKKSPQLHMLGGKIDNTLLTSEQIREYAKLPTLEQSRQELVSILNSPAARLSQLLQQNQQRLVGLLDQHSQPS